MARPAARTALLAAYLQSTTWRPRIRDCIVFCENTKRPFLACQEQCKTCMTAPRELHTFLKSRAVSALFHCDRESCHKTACTLIPPVSWRPLLEGDVEMEDIAAELWSAPFLLLAHEVPDPEDPDSPSEPVFSYANKASIPVAISHRLPSRVVFLHHGCLQSFLSFRIESQI